MVIKFYKVNDDYGCFSNFAHYSVNLKGKTWLTVEHYFQAQKFAGTQFEHKIRKANTPMLAAQMGRDRTIKIRKDWEKVKDNIMYEAVWTKFLQHPDIRILLISTGTAQIVEHTSRDSYWGDGGDGKGQNKLGRILMRVRDELSEL